MLEVAGLNPLLTRYAGQPFSLSASAFLKTGRDTDGRYIVAAHPLRIDVAPSVQPPSQPLISCLMVTQNRPRMAAARHRMLPLADVGAQGAGGHRHQPR